MTALLAFLWLCSSSAWGKALSDVRSSVWAPLPHCNPPNITCTSGGVTSMRSLSASVVRPHRWGVWGRGGGVRVGGPGPYSPPCGSLGSSMGQSCTLWVYGVVYGVVPCATLWVYGVIYGAVPYPRPILWVFGGVYGVGLGWSYRLYFSLWVFGVIYGAVLDPITHPMGLWGHLWGSPGPYNPPCGSLGSSMGQSHTLRPPYGLWGHLWGGPVPYGSLGWTMGRPCSLYSSLWAFGVIYGAVLDPITHPMGLWGQLWGSPIP